MKVYSNKNVLEMARERISMIFDDFEVVIVPTSGGKDSTLTMELAIEEARRRDRLPVKVMFLDQEAEWQGTVRYMEGLLERPEIEFWWIQVPFRLENAASFGENWLYCWDKDNPDKWMRPKHILAFTDDIFETNQFYKLFDKAYPVVAGSDNFAVIYGLRAAESPQRAATVCLRPVYKDWTYSSHAGRKKGTSFKFAVVYDWRTEDVWAAIQKFGWTYNEVYDKQLLWGRSPYLMRVSSLTHGMAAKTTLKMIQEIEPETYEALVKRITGIDTYGKLGDEMVIHQLPEGFSTWEEYARNMFDNLLGDEGKAAFQKRIKKAEYDGIADATFWKELSGYIQENDIHGTQAEMIRAAKGVEAFKKERKYETNKT